MRTKFIFLFSLILTLFCFTQNAYAETFVEEDILIDTVWTKDQGPYVVDFSLYVAPEATLTIEAGVVVKFSGDLYVAGRLNVNGTSEESVHFISLYDDSSWGAVTFDSSLPSTLDHLVMRDTSGDIFFYNAGAVNSASLNIDQGVAVLNSSVSFSKLKSRNIEVFAGGSLVANSADISGSINIFGGSELTLKNATVFSDFGVTAISVYDESSAILENVEILGEDSDGGVDIFSDSSVDIMNLFVAGVQNGLAIFNDSFATIQDLDVSCESIGVYVATNSSLELDGGDIACGQYGLFVFDRVDVVVSGVKISGAVATDSDDAGVFAFGNSDSPNENSIHITDSEIVDNENGFFIFRTHLVANDNTIVGNTRYGVFTFPTDPLLEFDFTGNWWGDASGPYHATLNPEGLGNAVSELTENVNFDSWCEREGCDTRYPVIIVPGLLGTELVKPTEDGEETIWLDLVRNALNVGDEFLEVLGFEEDLTPSDLNIIIGDVIRREMIDLVVAKPTLFNYSFSLIEEFKNQGYTEGTDLFLFPYDWRYGVDGLNVNKLKEKIAEVMALAGSDKVDIVAHSMGGLITKKYVLENADHYLNKVVMVGVPNTGAPKAVKNLIIGDGNLLTADSAMKNISKNAPAAYDVLPSREYYDKKGSFVEIVEKSIEGDTHKNLTYEEAVSFLIADHGLNAQAMIEAMDLHTSEFDNYDMRSAGLELYSINGCKEPTISKFREVRIPQGAELLLRDTLPPYILPHLTPGDKTVPLESATNLPINQENKFYALAGEHGEMLTAEGIRQQIVNIIAGSSLSTLDGDSEEIITQDINKCELNGRAIAIYSPLAIEVIDQDGNRAGFYEDGTSVENNIPNASFEVFGEQKFVFLPTDDGQTYTVNIYGTGTGVFTLTDSTITGNEVVSMQVFSNIAVTPSLLGSVTLADNTTLALDNDGDGDTDQVLNSTSSLNAEEAENFIPEHSAGAETLEESTSNTTSGSSARNNAPVVVPVIQIAESLPNIPELVQEIIPKVAVVENVEDNASVTQESTQDENLLTANVADTDAPIDTKVVVITIISALSIMILVKIFYKV